MSKQHDSVGFLAIAAIFILPGFFAAVLTLTGTFEKTGFELLLGFNTYLFGMLLALTLAVIGGLLFFVLHAS
jgi:hypothetical protein